MANPTTSGRRARTATALAAIASTLAAVATWAAWPVPTTDRARAAYERGDWASAASDAAAVLARDPGDDEAARLRARGLARLGRDAEALALDAKIGGGKLEAEDLVLAGRGLLDRGRTDLGWAAIDAASKLDPGHPGASEALASRSRSGPTGAIGKGDRLSAIPGGPALAELVVGLATLEPGGATGADPGRLLAGVLRRDRPALLKVATPADARKLLARALLERGRAGEALDRLATLDDLEAHWLRSRAYLVEGDLARARASDGLAGAFGRADPAAPEPSRYVGARRCESCHAEIYATQQSGRHASTLAGGVDLAKVPLPDGPVVDPGNPAVVHRFRREGGRIEVASGDPDGLKAARAVVDYALGSGHRGVTMLAKDGEGRHRSLRISYYTGGDHWGLTSGFEAKPADPQAYLGEPTGAEGFFACVNCHATRFTSDFDRDSPEAADRGIGCERCHGPGDHHVRAMESGFPRVAIGRPRLATPAGRLKLCAQCHGSDGTIPPADPRFIRFQATTLPHSRCSTGSGGRLDCVACHDPHSDVETSPAYYEARCLACHGGESGKANAVAARFRFEAVSSPPCPVNPAGGCLPCHMPKVPEIMPFTDFTDHHIRARRPVVGTSAAGERR